MYETLQSTTLMSCSEVRTRLKFLAAKRSLYQDRSDERVMRYAKSEASVSILSSFACIRTGAIVISDHFSLLSTDQRPSDVSNDMSAFPFIPTF